MPFDDQHKGNSQSMNRYVLFVLLFSIFVASLSFLNRYFVTHWYWLLAIQLFAFLILGTIHMSAAEHAQSTYFSKKNDQGLRNTIMLSALLCTVVAIFYLVIKVRIIYLCVPAAASFLLPYFSRYTFKLFEDIPELKYQLWFKRDNLIDSKAFVFLASVPIKWKLNVSMFDNSVTVFNRTVPAQMELGKVFHYLLVQEEQNGVVIETEDEIGQEIGWQFYLEEWQGYKSKSLNPEANFWENQISPDATIIAKRVMVSNENATVNQNSKQHHELYQY